MFSLRKWLLSSTRRPLRRFHTSAWDVRKNIQRSFGKRSLSGLRNWENSCHRMNWEWKWSINKWRIRHWAHKALSSWQEVWISFSTCVGELLKASKLKLFFLLELADSVRQKHSEWWEVRLHWAYVWNIHTSCISFTSLFWIKSVRDDKILYSCFDLRDSYLGIYLQKCTLHLGEKLAYNLFTISRLLNKSN